MALESADQSSFQSPNLAWYRDTGILAEALLNFLSRTGLSTPANLSVHSYDNLPSKLDLDRVNLASPTFNLDTLCGENKSCIQKLTPVDLEKRLVDYIRLLMNRKEEFTDALEPNLPSNPNLRNFEIERRRRCRSLAAEAPYLIAAYETTDPGLLVQIIPLIQGRMHTLAEAADYLPMFLHHPFDYEKNDLLLENGSTDDTIKALKLGSALFTETDFDSPDWQELIERKCREKAEVLGLRLDQFYGPIRVAVSGRKVSVDLIQGIRLIGKEATHDRIRWALDRIDPGGISTRWAMPKKTHPSFQHPSNEKISVWRYMDFTKLVSMLDSKGMYFSRADMLGDPFESSIPKPNDDFWQRLAKIDSPKVPLSLRSARISVLHSIYVNCWHMNEHESAAMWRLYAKSNEAIAIKSTFAKLHAVLPEKPPIYCGVVRYLDYEKELIDQNNLLSPIVCKRRSFEHEREVRAVIVDELLSAKEREPGISIPVDLGLLIEAIYVAPNAPQWLRSLVERIVVRFGFDFPVRQSDLSKTPLF